MGVSRNKPSAEDPVVQAVLACISRHVTPPDSIVVGYSGGIDSTVLLHATHVVARQKDISLSAVHVHHGLNSRADAWADACVRTCKAFAIPIDVSWVTVAPQRGEGVEAAARRLRREVMARHPANWILLAHHADDQAETLLHNLVRGTGLRGAAAMPERLGRVLRPFLGFTRNELFAYANSNGLPWIEDDSNADCRYTRNYLRANILPALGTRFPRATEHLAAAAGRFGEASSLLDDLAQIDLGGHPNSFPVPLAVFRGLSESRARNLLRALLAWQGVQAPDERRLNEFVRQLRSAGLDRHPRLDLATYSLWCEKRRLWFARKD